MGFSGNSGGGSIATGTDVFLSSPANNHVLTYDGSTLKWKNAPASGTPNGGATNQVLVKATNADLDTRWADSVPLSNTAPAYGSGGASAGTAAEASRADHQHPLPPGIGYAIRSGMYSSPVGIPSSGTNTAGASTMVTSPLPVYVATTINTVQILARTTGATVSVAIYDGDPLSRYPRNRLTTPVSQSIGAAGYVQYNLPASLVLQPGVYWVAIHTTASFGFGTVQNGSIGSYHMVDNGYDAGNRCYVYGNGGTLPSMPTTISGGPFIANDGMPWYQVRVA